MLTSLKSARRKLFITFTLLALLASAATAVYADIFPVQPPGGSGNYTYWLSCGSSSGNYYYRCDNDTGLCDDCDTDACQESANTECSRRGF